MICPNFRNLREGLGSLEYNSHFETNSCFVRKFFQSLNHCHSAQNQFEKINFWQNQGLTFQIQTMTKFCNLKILICIWPL